MQVCVPSSQEKCVTTTVDDVDVNLSGHRPKIKSMNYCVKLLQPAFLLS